jgi:hypothetical protein
MKQVLGIILLLCSVLVLQAQTAITTATFNKLPQTAVQFNIAFSDEAVENGLANKLAAYGKPKKIKEYLVYRNVNIPEISSTPVTLYFNVERKSKKDNNNSVLTLMLSNEFDRFYSKETDSTLFNNALQYLKGFEAPVAAASLELNILAQDENAQKSDKKLKKLRDEAINLEKDKVRIEEKIAQRKKEIEKEEIELAKQKELLDGLLKQRIIKL